MNILIYHEKSNKKIVLNNVNYIARVGETVGVLPDDSQQYPYPIVQEIFNYVPKDIAVKIDDSKIDCILYVKYFDEIVQEKRKHH